jgi:hypothetical protein
MGIAPFFRIDYLGQHGNRSGQDNQRAEGEDQFPPQRHVPEERHEKDCYGQSAQFAPG